MGNILSFIFSGAGVGSRGWTGVRIGQGQELDRGRGWVGAGQGQGIGIGIGGKGCVVARMYQLYIPERDLNTPQTEGYRDGRCGKTYSPLPVYITSFFLSLSRLLPCFIFNTLPPSFPPSLHPYLTASVNPFLYCVKRGIIFQRL